MSGTLFDFVAPLVSISGVVLATVASVKIALSRKKENVDFQQIIDNATRIVQKNSSEMEELSQEVRFISGQGVNVASTVFVNLTRRFQEISNNQGEAISILISLGSKIRNDQERKTIDLLIQDMSKNKVKMENVTSTLRELTDLQMTREIT